jgi:hypothetical protein
VWKKTRERECSTSVREQLSNLLWPQPFSVDVGGIIMVAATLSKTRTHKSMARRRRVDFGAKMKQRQ